MIAKRLTDEGHAVASLHGDKMTNDRDDILNTFRNGKTKVLITTNVVARGIDIQQVNMVVNYDVPDLGPEGDWKPDIETYIHRIGKLPRPCVSWLAGKLICVHRSNWSIWPKGLFGHFRARLSLDGGRAVYCRLARQKDEQDQRYSTD